jgi:excisionase family DNA binding protein
MSTQTALDALTVPQVAAELNMTPNGVYKLIQRGKLGAVRTAARKTRVPREVLDAFKAAQQAKVDAFLEQQPVGNPEQLRAQFEQRVGRSPEDFVAAWKADLVEDTAENMRLLVLAVGLRLTAGEPGLVREDAVQPVFAAARQLSRQ